MPTPSFSLFPYTTLFRSLSRTNDKNLVLNFSGIGKDIPTFADAQAIADQIALLPTEYASIKIVHNKFINATSYEPRSEEHTSELQSHSDLVCRHLLEK